MPKTIESLNIAELVSTAVTKKHIYGTVLCVENGDNTYSFIEAAGNLTEDKPYFIASVTKLYVTAILMKLKHKNKLQLENNISQYLPDEILEGLHVYKGIDYSKNITIKHLLSNTSGIPDYFSADVVKELSSGKDQTWGFERVIASAKNREPKFEPGKRAQYSDTNFQLLGRIIETITKKDFPTILKEFIFDELQLQDTYLFEDLHDDRPAPLYFKDKELFLPKYMSSLGPEGGIVSTAKDSMIFLKAFFNGQLFPKEYLSELMNWKIMFAPGLFFYGVGIANQPVSLKNIKNGLIGHWGQTGSFAFYHPETDLYFTGTTNQFFGQSVAAKVMLKVIKTMK